MRLEIEPTLAALHVTDEAPGDGSGADSVEAKAALNKGIKAAQAGDRVQARASLLRATEIDPKSEGGWLWLASISEYPEELLGFLNHVLEINPENQRALEWKAATNALLSKTFVQRGIDASQENQKEFAAECFQTALEYDDQNAAAWMWMASLSNSNTAKINLLQKALTIDPANDAAGAALAAAKTSILKERLTEAKAAAVSGNNAEATRVLDELLSSHPDSIEAWTMRSHLADGFDEKIRCFESILAIDPDNVAAKSGRDSLLTIFGTVEAANAERIGAEPDLSEGEVAREMDSEAYFQVNEPVVDKNPTQDLEMPMEVDEADLSPVILAQTRFENENENESMECGAEPFSPFTPEAAEPVTADHESGNLDAADAATDFSFTAEVNEPEVPYADAQAETVMFTYDHEIYPEDDSEVVATYEAEHMPSDPEIPMPTSDFSTLGAPSEQDSPPDTGELLEARPESVECPFCGQSNEPQNFSCHACMAVLTLSDLELLLANQSADKLILRRTVEEMERKRSASEFSSDELITLGLGHLNLRNLQLGYSCLLAASKLDPNNVVLSGQVNSLLIRLEEIKQQEEAHLKMPKGKSILVVDDSPTVRKLIAGKLEKCGHDVICASDGVEAIERLDHFIPDLVLLDITMPRMDGYQVCKTIRGNNSTKDVPVVMISGKDGFFDKVRGRMAGTTGYITKPFGPETLMKAVEMYLSGEISESDEV